MTNKLLLIIAVMVFFICVINMFLTYVVGNLSASLANLTAIGWIIMWYIETKKS